MERARKILNSRPRWSLMLLASSGLLVAAVACGSGDDNAGPSTPVITTGGTGGAGGKSGTAGSTSSGGSTSTGGTTSTGGKSGTAGSAQGGTGGTDVVGTAGEGGEAGASTGGNTCPTTDEGFLNQPSSSQSSKFDNDARLGAHATLPPLPT